ncbi:hypothetical protein QTP88_022132 [Uroleucon formosanum]
MYGSTSYLSFSVYEKFIEMMGEKVKNTIINEIKNAKYFSIVVDSTPDISHTDQLACIFRYVKTNDEPVERFLQFITNSGHKSEDLADAIFMVIGENELDIKNCRGQSYDNASNMSGVYSGLQARIKGACPYAIFVPCAAHSLNLVGEYAANCCTLGTEFFNFLQALYTFFSASTYRWEILSDYLTNSKNKTVKRLSDTRWAARHEACSSLSQNWTELLKALNSFVENPIENSKTKCDSTGLIKKMNRLEMCILVSFWNDILERFNSTSKKLQTIEIDLTIVINLYTSLINYVTDLRNTFSHYEKLAMEKSEIKEYKVVRKKKRKIPYDESCQGDTSFEARESFKINTYFVIIDSLLSELRKRKSCYDDINTMFGFFSNMIDLPVIEVRKKATKLQSQYPEDLDGSFINECIHFHGYLKSLPGIVSPKSILELCKIIEDHNIADVYPYVDIALRMYLCCPVSNTSAEWSFSVLKRVKSYLRSSMNDNRLNNLAILNIECEITKSISYNEVIEDFAAQKSHHHIIQELKSRFSDKFVKVIPLEGLIPIHKNSYRTEAILNAAMFYEQDLLSSSDLVLKAEINLWKTKWNKIETNIPHTAVTSLPYCEEYFLNIKILLQLFATLPVSTATAERSFSTLRRLKNYMRSTMTESRLNGLALLNIHKEKQIDIDLVVDQFTRKKKEECN